MGTYAVVIAASGGGSIETAIASLTVVEAENLPTGYGWHQLANTNMTSVCLGNVANGMYSDSTMTTTTNYNFDCYQIIPWSGGAVDDTNQRLIVWGGGHSDYAGNEVSALNLKGTPSWQAITTPTIPVPYIGDGKNWEGLQPYFVRLADGGQPQPGASPSSRHTYNGIQYVPYQNKLYSFGGAVANGGYFSPETWALDMGKAAWTLLGPPYSLAPGYPTTAYNPTTGHIVMHDKNWNLLDFNPNTGNWTTLSNNSHIDDGTTAAIDPVNNLFVVVGASGTPDNLGYPSVPTSQTVQAFLLTSPYTLLTWSDPSCDLVYRSGGLTWDSALGLMVGYPGGGNQVYLLNSGPQDVVTAFGTVRSHKCLDVPISLNPSPVKGVDYPQDPEGTNYDANLGIFGRFAYFASLDSFALVNDRTKNAWTVQLTGGSSAPSFSASTSPGTVTVPEGSQGTSVISTTVSGGFNNAVTLSAVGMPQGVTASFSPSTIAAPGAGSSTMTITVPADTPVGTYPLMMSAFGGGDTVNRAVTLVVTAGGQPNFTISASPSSLTIAARQSGQLDDHDDDQRRIQQRHQSVGCGSTVGDDGEFQSQPDTGAGRGHLDHDDHGGRQHAGGNLSHHGNGQRRRHPAEHHGHADGDGTTTAELRDLGLAVFADDPARQSGKLDDHDDDQRRIQQRHQSVGCGRAVGDDGEFQSQPDTGAGRGQLDDDDHGGRQHAGGNLSHHGDGQRRRHSAEHDGHADGERLRRGGP